MNYNYFPESATLLSFLESLWNEKNIWVTPQVFEWTNQQLVLDTSKFGYKEYILIVLSVFN